jgi:hypothetical protein
MAAFAKASALLTAIWTTMLAAYVLGWQALSLTTTGEWTPFPISHALAVAGLETRTVFTTASVARSDFEQTPISTFADALLDLPTSGLLLFGAAVLLAVSVSLGSIEQEIAASEE